ncbi:MAG: VapC toxin family PIN domain ribonuclease [Spirochaetae bacterium HGW-Spirochaetae-3]|jgi:predicted nucleic acid-binding protein|nr:MAG: VapC toxin family PIN domain ribonuclease [Spirochaetae bacterium HGW-Spirochaetae-3]
MNVVDSSCWLEFFSGSAVGETISPFIEDIEGLLVPSITLYEVFKKILQELDEDKALFAVAHMKQGRVVELDADLAIYAAKVGKEYRLAMADSIIYAVARKFGATLWTQDKHFKDLPNVRYFKKE